MLKEAQAPTTLLELDSASDIVTSHENHSLVEFKGPEDINDAIESKNQA